MEDKNLFFFKRGLIKEKEGKYESAIRDFDESLILDPMFYRSIIAKANIYLKVPELKNCLKAQEQLLKAIRYEENAEIMLKIILFFSKRKI